ncbi:MAG TPA: SDR family NAD(P)-dependent oxidoreductase [Syntrophales bacterium]|nr:SDR family NAD(P)-dependent oxidoreductase [Syntrophales bacterium]HOH73299.1 SDR family NAD(P)-dependent oxidoreductase [Syntrophales bacterium]HPN08862.1 SDR family NAD(P)-dependent oxidoreductase [Syntrophales bacterium]HPX82638.1 SDR family NAD(P)-dependent oxidoreductase [Syntrophales bacterium]
MALNLEAIGKKIGPVTKTYTWKDAALYALGIGAGFDELDYVYEKNLKVIPSFSVAGIFGFFRHVARAANVNLAGILHGEQDIIFYRPIPTGGALTTEGSITHYYDKKDKGAVVIAAGDTCDADGNKLFKNVITMFSRFDGNFGGEEGKTEPFVFPASEPDFVVTAQPSPDQPLLYRLSGDFFQLHVDPDFARQVGFEKPIMHGLCTHGFACRALMEKLTPGQPDLVRRLACRFSKPLYPGEPIRTLIWKTGEGRAVWRTLKAKTGDVVIDNGIFEYGPAAGAQIRFDGRVAVITGAGGGLGRVYALELAKRGAKVVINDFGAARDGAGDGSSSPADKVVAEIKAAGGEAVANYDNVATPEGGERIVKTALDSFGRLDILINNAGIIRDKGLLKMETENWRAVIDVHLNGAYHVTRPAFAAMRDQGYGRIVMTTSASGLYGNFGQTNYSAAKLGLVGFMNTIKIEGQKYNIKVNSIAPIAASRLTEDILPPDIFAKLKPEFVAPIVLYLVSETCGVTGHIFNAGMGFYNRAAILTGPGTVIGDGRRIPTLEEVADNWEKIGDMEGAKEYFQLMDQVTDLLNAFAPKPKAAAAETTSSDPGSSGGASAIAAAATAGDGTPAQPAPPTVAGIFAQMQQAFQAEKAAGVNVVFQFHITGDGGGDWFAEVKDGACRIEAGKRDAPTTTITMAAGDFLDMMGGKLSAMQAYTSGQIKIGGDLLKSQLIEKLFKLR